MLSNQLKKPIFGIGLTILVVLAFGLGLYYQHKTDFGINQAFHHLNQNTKFKVEYLKKWLFERKADAIVSANNPIFNAELYQTGKLSPYFKEHIHQKLELVRESYGYDMITMVDKEGKTLYSSHPTINLSSQTQAKALQSIKSQTSLHTSIFVDTNGSHRLDFIAPMLYSAPKGQKISVGAIILHIDPVKEIYPILNQWSQDFSFGKTELIVTLDIEKPITSSSNQNQVTTQQTIAIKNFEQIVTHIQAGKETGNLELFSGHSHHLVHYRTIPNTNWVMIAQAERSKILETIFIEIFWVGIVFLLLGSLTVVILFRIKDRETIQLQQTHSEELQRNQDYYQTLFMDAPLPYQSLNAEGIILHVNHAWEKLFGYSSNEVLGKHFKNFISKESFPTLKRNFPRFLQNQVVKDVEFMILTKSGAMRETVLEGRLSNPEDKEKLRTHCILVDVTEQREKERGLKLAYSVFENLGEGIMVTDADCKIISVNYAFQSILGYKASEVLGKTPAILHSGQHDDTFYQKMWHDLDTQSLWQGEIWNRKKNGELVAERLTISVLKQEDGSVDKYIGVFADISQIKQSEEELDYITHHDPLTKLPNRQKFLNAIEFSIKHAKRDQTEFCVLILDLDLFKKVNDSFGHSFGDEVLVEMTKRLQNQLRETAMLSRLGGDEFILLLDNIENHDEPARLAVDLIERVQQPFVLSNNKELKISASVGISLYPLHGLTANELFQHADSALYVAKQNGRSTYQFYTEDLTQKAQDRILIENGLRTAILNNELLVFYQPQVNIQNGTIDRAEALVRWQHPEHGLLSPANFIPIAEESNLIIDLGNWVLQEACRQAKSWLDQGFKPVRVAVNASAKQILYSDLYAIIVETLKETKLPAELLEIEITESSLVSLGDESIKLFEKLRGLGVTIAIDDFGTGYSSMSYLQELNFDVLKIDKKFIDAVGHDEKGMQIVNTIISMAQSLRLEVLAEGVESQPQLDFLSLKGCDFYQGYLTSPSVEATIFEKQFLKPIH